MWKFLLILLWNFLTPQSLNHKLINRNTVKITYSCMPSRNSVIKSRINQKVLQYLRPKDSKTANNKTVQRYQFFKIFRVPVFEFTRRFSTKRVKKWRLHSMYIFCPKILNFLKYKWNPALNQLRFHTSLKFCKFRLPHLMLNYRPPFDLNLGP